METPRDDPMPDEPQSQAPEGGDPPSKPAKPEDGGSYEDSWYQVLKRRSEQTKPGDEQQGNE